MKRVLGWPFGQGQDLVTSVFDGDEVPVDKGVASLKETMQRHLEQLADSIVTVVTDAIAVAHKDQEKVKQKLIRTHGFEIAMMEQTVVDPAKGPSDPAQAVEANGLFAVIHGRVSSQLVEVRLGEETQRARKILSCLLRSKAECKGCGVVGCFCLS
jgi:hypothetical protein